MGLFEHVNQLSLNFVSKIRCIGTYTLIGTYEREGTYRKKGTFRALGTYERRGTFTEKGAFTGKGTYAKESAFSLACTYRHTFSAVLAKIPGDPSAPIFLRVAVTLCRPLIVTALAMMLFPTMQKNVLEKGHALPCPFTPRLHHAP
jgi:hypothetical protein